MRSAIVVAGIGRLRRGSELCAALQENGHSVSELKTSSPLVLLDPDPHREVFVRVGHEVVVCRSDAGEIHEAISRCPDGSRPSGIGRGRADLVGGSAPMQAVRERIGRIAQTESNVLITGETGTGKELAANLIHEQSKRANRPLVSVNCAAIPDTLIELFGHEQGVFTGATSRRQGLLKLADGGTLFLDEIGDLDLRAQAKILRAIEITTGASARPFTKQYGSPGSRPGGSLA